jgi:hypothetical protein
MAPCPASFNVLLVRPQFSEEFEVHYRAQTGNDVYVALQDVHNHQHIYITILEQGGLGRHIKNVDNGFSIYEVPSECTACLSITDNGLTFDRYKYVVLKMSKLMELLGPPASYIAGFLKQADFYFENYCRKIDFSGANGV